MHVLIHRWHTKQVDVVLAYPQVKIENTRYIRFLYRVKEKQGSTRFHVFKLEQNIYNQKQTGLICCKKIPPSYNKLDSNQALSMSVSTFEATTFSSSI